MRASAVTDRLGAFLDEALGGHVPLTVEPMAGGGSCDLFAVARGDARLVLRRAPAHASSATAHDVTREFRILDAIKDTGVRVARPLVSCDDPSVFGAPFYVMEHVDGVPVRNGIPEAWAAAPVEQARAFEELVDAIADVHAVDWRAVGLDGLGRPERFLERQVPRWLAQLDSYRGRPLAPARGLAGWLEANLPPEQPPTLFHGDYKADNVLYAASSPPRLLAIVDWEMASIGDPLVDVAWAMIFHPAPGKAMSLGMHGTSAFDLAHVPPVEQLLARYAARSGRDLTHMRWYDVFARWKLAIALEGSYAKWERGESTKPVHEFFGPQADRLLAEAEGLVP